MNALDYLLADIKAAHRGEKLPKRHPVACPQGQAARPAKQRQAKPAPQAKAPAIVAQATKPAAPKENPIIARALAVLRAEMKGQDHAQA